MWGVLEDIFYIVIFLLFISTFLPKPIRARVRESLGELWRLLPHLWRAIEPHAYLLVTGRPMPDDEPAFSDRRLTTDDRRRTEPFAEVRTEIPHPDEEEQRDEPVRSVREEDDSLRLTREEQAAVARMIAHNATAESPTQSSTIEAGFGYKRGGGAGYERAKAIYKALFEAPNVIMYPTLMEARKQTRKNGGKAAAK